MRALVLAAFVFDVVACTPLTANAPLFSVADQTGPPPFTEGAWVTIDEHCTRAMASRHTLPRSCHSFSLRRDADGAWRVSGSDKDDHGAERTFNSRLIIVPAVQVPPDGVSEGSFAVVNPYAPLYVAEFNPSDFEADAQADASHHATTARTYSVIAPIGSMPARELVFVEIECSTILREGPMDGVATEHDTHGNLTGCIAVNQGAVREAARRAMIESLGQIDDNRTVFVHP
jgi:hypothetical protein